jgi:Ser/Thr protein kinase RdoA (MazF antagonist)
MAEEPATAPGPAALVGQPRFTPADVRHLIREHWDLDADVEPLDSERDQNWALIEAGQRRAVLKVANSADSPEALDLQIEMMARLSMAGLPVPPS